MTAADPATSPRTSTTYVDVSDLHPVGVRPPLGRYVADLWRRRSFVLADSRARTFTSNRDMLLGNAWLVGKPLLDGATYFVIFGLIFGAREGVENFIGFLLIGVFLYRYTARCLTTGISAISSGQNLIRTFAFPRAAIPLAAWLRETLTSIPMVLTLVVLVLAIPPHAVVTSSWVLFPAVLALQSVFNLGLMLYSARFGSLIPDMKVFIGFFTRLWMYGSGVMFSVERISNGHPLVMAICEVNPLYCVLTLARDTALYGSPGEVKLWVVLAVWAVVTPVLGFVYFWHGEEQYGRD